MAAKGGKPQLAPEQIEQLKVRAAPGCAHALVLRWKATSPEGDDGGDAEPPAVRVALKARRDLTALTQCLCAMHWRATRERLPVTVVR